MRAINEKDLERAAKNARISLSGKEKKEILPQLREVLSAFSRLDELDTKATRPSFQPVEVENVFREDTPAKCLSQEEALSLTKHKKGAYFKGPRVI